MKIFISIISLATLSACNNPDRQNIKAGQRESSTTDSAKAPTENSIPLSEDIIFQNPTIATPTVLVLPPHDIIANAGISPDIHQYLENIVINDSSCRLIKFPYRQLMNVPYQNVFDKKYCGPIIEKVKTDIIILSKLEQATRSGNMTTDKWNFKIKIYNTQTGIQQSSSLEADNLAISEMDDLIKSKQKILFNEIRTITQPALKTGNKIETLTLSYNAISCTCAQWSESKFDNTREKKVYYWLEPSNENLINADKIFKGENLPIQIKVTGQIVSENGFPKRDLPKVEEKETGKVFRYTKIEVLKNGH